METSKPVALVTGGARGIGAAICRRLAARGHPIVINYAHSTGPAAELAAQIEAAGGRAVALRADVADEAAVTTMFEAAASAVGAPTILVNNAGISTPAAVIKMAPDTWDRTIAVNLSGAFYCTRAALPAMYAQGWGRIVFLGSPGGGRTISPGMAAYAAAKAGVAAMTKALALETARRGITVNTVVPGYVATDMTSSNGEAVTAHMEATWPKIPPEAVAALIAFLVSPDGDHVSGEDVAVWHGGPSPIEIARRATSGAADH